MRSLFGPVVLAVATLAFATAPHPASASTALTGPQVGTLAPPFTLRTIDGRTVTLETYRGKTLVINAWATWCPPCRQETPDLLKAYARLHSQGVEFLGIDNTEEAPIVHAFVAAKSVPYPQAIDSDKAFSNAYDIRYFPTTYVIDPSGFVRARYIDVLTAHQLATFVLAAQSGRDALIVSPQQQKIDDLLAGQGISFEGETASIVRNVKKVNDLVDAAEKLIDESDAAKGLATDLLRTRTEEAVLRDRAIDALAHVAISDADRALLARDRGDAARDREQWKDALTYYHAVLLVEPNNEDALGGVAFVAGPLKLYDEQIAADEKLLALHPDDVDQLIDLGVAYSSAKHDATAESTLARATDLAMSHLAAKPGVPALIRKVAATHLFAGRAYVKAGDRVRARAEFDALREWTLKLPKDDIRYAMYLEEGQEALVALDLSAPATDTTVSLTPWTGPDLPGSIASTLKYRLVVAGSAGKNVALRAADVPKGWIASFCTDRICSPFKTTVDLPQSGVKVIEFQLVPPDARSRTPKVRVIENDGAHTATTTT